MLTSEAGWLEFAASAPGFVTETLEANKDRRHAATGLGRSDSDQRLKRVVSGMSMMKIAIARGYGGRRNSSELTEARKSDAHVEL